MQEITHQYGIFEEVFIPFTFNDNKKSTKSSNPVIDFSNPDDLFDLSDTDNFFS